MAVPPGTRLGVYEIIAKIGEGGMGEVYRARDTTLNRDVAVKVLPEIVAGDAERLARFQREAQTLAALNHPNIAQVYGFDQGAMALVMELVQGEDLAARLSRGALPLADALPIARQIAEALAAAHERGIVHRDLKPANIKVQPDGVVKVLDFGLAKAIEADKAGSVDPMNSPTVTVRGTEMGVILGTAAYMAPEQARGRPVDRRADVWAFGVVLFEMLTGRRAFDGRDVSELLASVLKDTPPLDALPAGTPPSIRRLLKRCLEKDPAKRLDSMAAARLEIDEALAEPSPEVVTPKTSVRGGRVWPLAVLAGIAALVAAVFTAWLLRPAPLAAPAARTEFVILPPEKGAALGEIAISPAGDSVAFVSILERRRSIWIRRFDSVTSVPLAGTDDASYPFWSPDGAWLGFFAQGQLRKVPVAGGAAVTLCEAPSGRGATWGPADVILFAPSPASPIHKVSAQGGTSTPVTGFDAKAGETTHRFPMFLPDGRHFLFNTGVTLGVQIRLAVASLDGGPPKYLTDAGNAFFAAGRLVYPLERTILAQPFDTAALELRGEAVPVERNPTAQSTGGFDFAASSTALVRRVTEAGESLVWFDRGGRRDKAVAGLTAVRSFELSPDGRYVIAAVQKPNRNENELWLADLERGTSVPFARDAWDYGNPTWSADGSRVLYPARLTQAPEMGFFEQPVGSDQRRQLYEAPPRTMKLGLHLLERDRLLFFTIANTTSRTDLWGVRLEGDRKPFLVAALARQPALSPDGRWLAYVRVETGRPEVVVQGYPDGGRRTQISTAGGLSPRWRRDMRELFFRAENGSLMSVPWQPGEQPSPGTAAPLFSMGSPESGLGMGPGLGFSVTQNGERFLIPVADAGVVPDSYVVTLNWAAGSR